MNWVVLSITSTQVHQHIIVIVVMVIITIIANIIIIIIITINSAYQIYDGVKWYDKHQADAENVRHSHSSQPKHS